MKVTTNFKTKLLVVLLIAGFSFTSCEPESESEIITEIAELSDEDASKKNLFAILEAAGLDPENNEVAQQNDGYLVGETFYSDAQIEERISNKHFNITKNTDTPCIGASIPILRLYRYYNHKIKNHTYALNPNIRWPGYVREDQPKGLRTGVIGCKSSDTKLIYRFYNHQRGDHYFTASISEGRRHPGYVFEGIMGSIWKTGNKYRTPWYHYWNPTVKNNFYTRNPGRENLAGYRYIKRMGYVWKM